MITCTLGEKKYSVDFISGRALREIGDAKKMYELVTKNAQAAERGEPLDESVEYTEILDTMVRWFCVLFNNQFTPDEFYDNYPADKVMFDIAMALIAVNRAATNVLSEFPTKADPAPRKK
ncbi:MAG: hypothetical protein IKE30_06445 [Clostridia bacterium]|nr:hypothetical protein [Clostridia bacterium]